jgi:NADH-quinone oxidoreductase subunit G
MEKKSATLTINGKQITVDLPCTVFEAAAKHGIFIPHYCYHPDLSIAGVCRMCLVDVEKNPKLQISCNTPAADGMVINTNNPKVKEAVKGVLELHLINHPLDCPICDKAGECKLQDFYVDYGLYESRIEMKDKVHKPKVVDIGTIVLDAERCILCSRCVRFTDEVTKTHELAIVNRGDRAELKTYDSGPLRNDYTGNLADICPVGALTAKDFRFQCRVWFLEKEESVCTLCARGCNTVVSANPQTKKVFRVEPRRNPEVNKSWMCDHGRWGYNNIYEQDRIKLPTKRVDGQWLETPWEQIFKNLKNEIENNAKVLVGLSTQLTNEEVFDAVTTLKALGVNQFTWLVDENHVKEKVPYDGILRHSDTTANANGFIQVMQSLNTNFLPQSEALKKINAKSFSHVLLLGIEDKPLACVTQLIEASSGIFCLVHASNFDKAYEKASVIVPNTTSFEKRGTLINALGRLQKLSRALNPQYMSRDAHSFVFGLMQGNDRTAVSEERALEIFEDYTVKKLLSTETAFRKLNPMGIALTKEARHAEATL